MVLRRDVDQPNRRAYVALIHVLVLFYAKLSLTLHLSECFNTESTTTTTMEAVQRPCSVLHLLTIHTNLSSPEISVIRLSYNFKSCNSCKMLIISTHRQQTTTSILTQEHTLHKLYIINVTSKYRS